MPFFEQKNALSHAKCARENGALPTVRFWFFCPCPNTPLKQTKEKEKDEILKCVMEKQVDVIERGAATRALASGAGACAPASAGSLSSSSRPPSPLRSIWGVPTHLSDDARCGENRLAESVETHSAGA